MSADSRPSTPEGGDDDPEWRPSSSPNNDRDEAVSSIRDGITKVIEGGTEVANSVILLLLLILFESLDDDHDDEMSAQERSAEWDARAEPIQERFNEKDVSEGDVADAIEWTRSE